MLVRLYGWGQGNMAEDWEERSLNIHFYNIVSPYNIKSVINFIKLSKDRIKMLLQDGLEFLLFKSDWFMNMWESFHYLISVQFIRHFVLFWVNFFLFFLFFLIIKAFYFLVRIFPRNLILLKVTVNDMFSLIYSSVIQWFLQRRSTHFVC